jgi:ribosomal protein S18 acetylase RimI-like enzyme
MYHAPMRAVTVEDSDELAAIEMELFPENCMNEHSLAREIDLGGGFVICEHGAIIAYMLYRGDARLVDIIRLGVVPAHQGRGLGPWLLKQGLELAEYVMLTVQPENKRALRIYLKHGFDVVGQLKGNDGWVLGAAVRRPSRHFIGRER